MTNVGYATLDVVPSTRTFSSRLERGITPGMGAAGRRGGVVFGDAAGSSAGSRFAKAFRRTALVGGLAGGVLLARFTKGAIGQASDLNESLNAVDVTYGKQARSVKKLGRESAKSLGLSNNEFNSLAVRFASFSKTIAGGNGKKVVNTLDDLTTRASDFASVMNLEAAEAATLFQSGLAGESEPLRRFGIDLSAASVEAFAYANGIAEGGSKLTEAQKVQARYGSIMEQTQKTQGDFKNTSDELANSQRILSARWDDARAKIGTALLPLMKDLVNFVLDHGIPAFEDFARFFKREGIPKIKDLGEAFGTAHDKAKPFIDDFLTTAKNLLEDIEPVAKRIVDAFNNLPSGAKKALFAVGGLVALSKIAGGGGGGGGLLSGGRGTVLGAAREAGVRQIGEAIANKVLKFTRKGETPANPLYVLDVGAGLGAGKLGAGSKVLGALGKGGLLAAFGLATFEAAKIDKDLIRGGLSGAGGGGTRGNPFGGEFKGSAEALSFQEKFGTTLDRNRDKIFANKEAIEEFGQSVRTRIPRTIETKFTLLGIDVANGQINALFDTFIARNNRLQSQFPAGGEGGSTQPPNHSPGDDGKGGGKPSGRTIVVTNNFNVNTTADAEKWDKHRRQQVAMGGFG